MKMRISEELNDIVKYAREEAMRTGSYGIGVDHLMLGLLRHAENNACRALAGLGIELSELKSFIDSHVFLQDSIPYSDIEKVGFSRGAQSILNLSILEATRLKNEEADSIHLLLAISRSSENYSSAFLRDKGAGYTVLLTFVQDTGLAQPSLPDADPEEEAKLEEAVNNAAEQISESNENSVEEYGYDLTKAAAAGILDPVVGREEEIARIVEILGRRRKNNPMLIGEPGVGKSAIVEALAIKIASGDVSPVLSRKRLISLDIASVVAGTRYRGDFEKRLKGK